MPQPRPSNDASPVTVTPFDLLPIELLRRIFKDIEPDEVEAFKAMRLVSQTTKRIVEDLYPSFPRAKVRSRLVPRRLNKYFTRLRRPPMIQVVPSAIPHESPRLIVYPTGPRIYWHGTRWYGERPPPSAGKVGERAVVQMQLSFRHLGRPAPCVIRCTIRRDEHGQPDDQTWEILDGGPTVAVSGGTEAEERVLKHLHAERNIAAGEEYYKKSHCLLFTGPETATENAGTWVGHVRHEMKPVPIWVYLERFKAGTSMPRLRFDWFVQQDLWFGELHEGTILATHDAARSSWFLVPSQ